MSPGVSEQPVECEKKNICRRSLSVVLTKHQPLVEQKTENENSFILSVDLKLFRPIPGVIQIVGDIRSRDVHNQIWEIMNGEKFDLIISDIHPGRSSSTGMDQKLLITRKI